MIIFFSKIMTYKIKYSSIDDVNKTHTTFPYAKGTAVGTLRKHLLTHHFEDWVAQCTSLGLTIKGKEAQEAVAALTGSSIKSQVQPRPKYTPEALVDALVKLIVANDLVSHYLFIFIKYLIFFFLF
jgi:hypothetical protein